MSRYEVRLLPAASRDLERLDKPVARRIVRRLQWLSENVDATRLEALTGDLAGFYRLRWDSIASSTKYSRTNE